MMSFSGPFTCGWGIPHHDVARAQGATHIDRPIVRVFVERKPTALSNIRWRSHWFGTLPYLCIYCDFFLYFFKKK